MKRIILLTIFLLSILSVYATHEYIPYVQEGKVWVECDNQKNNWQVGIDGNVVMIDGVEYHTLQVESFNYWNNIVSSKTGSKLHGYIREEDKKVYVRELNSTKDNLIYDFGVQEGDTIDCADVVYDFDVRKECCIVVDSIKTATFYDKERKLYYVTCTEKFTYSDGREYPTYTSDVWVEGVGSIKLPIMSRLSDTHRWGASDRLEFKYFYDYNTQEVFPTTETPYSQFSYPGTTTDPEPEQKDYEYSPYVEEGKVWVDYDYMERYSQVGISGTTTIDHKEYHNLYIESFSLWGGNLSSKTDSKLHGYIREEDKKVYIRELNSTTEYLIYDFDVQVGDTINWETLTDNDNAIVIDSIKIDTYYGKERKLYYVTCIEKGPEGEEWRTGSDVWIEGVGSLEYPIMSVLDDRFRWGAAGMQYFKYCYNYNTQEIFPTTVTRYDAFSYPAPDTYFKQGISWSELNTSLEKVAINNYSIDKDTVINGKVYNVVICNGNNEVAYLCSDNTSVYRYNSAQNEENLLYDFGDWYVGKSVLLANYINDEMIKDDVTDCNIDQIGTIYDYDNRELDYMTASLTLKNGETVPTEDKILKGIGSVSSILYGGFDYIPMPDGSETQLLTFEENNVTIYNSGYKIYPYKYIDKCDELSPATAVWNGDSITITGTICATWDADNKVAIKVNENSISVALANTALQYDNTDNLYKYAVTVYVGNVDADEMNITIEPTMDFITVARSNIDKTKVSASTLTLHRSGDVLMATFPTVGKGEAITLYDATGRVVTTQPIREGATTTSIDVATLPDGIYIARLSNGSTAKVVL